MSSKQEIATLLASQGGQFSPIKKRAYLLPVGKDDKGKTRPAVPQFVYDIAQAVMAPGKVLKNPGLMINPETGRTSDYAIGRSADLAGMMTLGSGAIPAEANSLRMGIKAYHGSPHDFDRFDMSKIGTGEGAQAYGHGLYFAENEGVAKNYRDVLGGQIPFVDGTPSKDDYVRRAANHIAQMGWTPEQAAADGAQRLQRLKSEYAIGPMKGNEYVKAQIDYLEGFQPTLESLVGKKVEFRPAGRMYEVNIDANPDDFLDWDKPLSEQPKAMRALVDEKSPPAQKSGTAKVSALFNMPGAKGEMERRAKEAGIPGIKYLDAGSRGAGDGSRNYVVFDDKLISIVKKYGVAALVSAGVLSQAQGEEMKAQGFN